MCKKKVIFVPKKLLSHIILLSSLTSSYAADPSVEINDFESLLENVSTLATKKSLNVDYMPSVVSVVDAQTYIDAGIQNVGEALGMLPGIQMQLSPMGYTMSTVRGFKNPNAYLSDKIKLSDMTQYMNPLMGQTRLPVLSEAIKAELLDMDISRI